MKDNPQTMMLVPILIFFFGAVTGLAILKISKDKDLKYTRLFYLLIAWGIAYGSYACWLSLPQHPAIGIGIGFLIAGFAALIGYLIKRTKI
ncbi:MAG: hypothetical protein HC904_07825 [Blastochloris sp.]|nr:hypothetical protein [Blastochloris sp.]